MQVNCRSETNLLGQKQTFNRAYQDQKEEAMLETLAQLRDGRSKRCSSWDRSGRNTDCWRIEPGETRTLADIRGAGVIRHIWFTIGADDPLYLRQAVVRIYWDGQAHPSVEVPVGDLFGIGHARVG